MMKPLSMAGGLAASVSLFTVCSIGLLGLTGCGGGSSSQSLVSAAPASASRPAPSTPAASVSTASAGCSLQTYSPNFALETDPATGLPNHLYHWKGFPARVYFVPSTFLTADRKTQALNGFSWWALATGQELSFQEVAQASAANIVVQYETRGATNYGAVTEYHVDSSGQLLDATITFNMTYLVNVSDITPVAAHEFGHALGIGGHSNNVQDVMSTTAAIYNMTQLTTRDVNTIQTAYCGLPNGTVTPEAVVGNAVVSKHAGQSTTISCRFDIP